MTFLNVVKFVFVTLGQLTILSSGIVDGMGSGGEVHHPTILGL